MELNILHCRGALPDKQGDTLDEKCAHDLFDILRLSLASRFAAEFTMTVASIADCGLPRRRS